MKKLLLILLAVSLLFVFAACNDKQEETTTDTAELTVIKVGATPTPHAELLYLLVDDMAALGYDLQVIEFNDYVIPNTSVDTGELDANYFQHIEYMQNFNANNGTALFALAEIHYEPFGIYAGTRSSLDELEAGDTIAVPNDGTNEARALLLLQQEGLITLDASVDQVLATVLDIVENPLNLNIMELESAQLARALDDCAFAVINGNYALSVGLIATQDAVALENDDSLARTRYVNVLVCKEGNEENAGLLALADLLKSDEIRTYIDDTYQGAVVPLF